MQLTFQVKPWKSGPMGGKAKLFHKTIQNGDTIDRNDLKELIGGLIVEATEHVRALGQYPTSNEGWKFTFTMTA